MTRLLLLFVLLVMAGWAASLPIAGAQPADAPVLYGVTVLEAGSALRLPQEAWVCVRGAEAATDVTLNRTVDDMEEPLVFPHEPEGRSCQGVDGGGLVSSDHAQPVRVLVLADRPSERSGPGVVRLGAPGASILVRDVGEDAVVGVLADTVGTRTQILDWDTLEVLAATTDVEEVSVHGTRDGVAGRDVLVVVRDLVVESSVLVRWEDPDWFAPSPTIGVVAAVTAAGLFLVLYKGRPRRYG